MKRPFELSFAYDKLIIDESTEANFIKEHGQSRNIIRMEKAKSCKFNHQQLHKQQPRIDL